MGKKETLVLLWIFFMGTYLFSGNMEKEAELDSILPYPEGWQVSGEALRFHPENLFEYINGAAEIYLSYNFQELITAEYKEEESQASVSVEIYDMGSTENAFGIYSAERFMDSNFIPIGLQGYIEEGVLNFLVDRFYVKLFCFEGGDNSEEIMKGFAREICQRIGRTGNWPEVLSFFPQKNLISNSEKFILQNFLGYGFLHHGYLASYLKDELEFDCFIIEGESPEETREMLEKYLETRAPETIEETSWGFMIKDRYYQNIFLTQKGSYIAGVMKIKNGMEKIGKDYLGFLLLFLE